MKTTLKELCRAADGMSAWPKCWLRRAITTSLFFARSAGHTDRSVKQQTLAEALK
jgi:hypothetical protein